MTHYIIERLSWDTSGKEKETWKQCNKRDVEEHSFVVEDLKEASPFYLLPSLVLNNRNPLNRVDHLFFQTCSYFCVFAGWRI